MNENDDIYQNVWDIAISVLITKFISVNASVEKTRKV